VYSLEFIEIHAKINVREFYRMLWLKVNSKMRFFEAIYNICSKIIIFILKYYFSEFLRFSLKKQFLRSKIIYLNLVIVFA